MSRVLVILQLGLIAVILFTGPWWARHPAAQGAELLAATLGVWAVGTMWRGSPRVARGKLRIGPEVAPGATLVTAGPYRWIRHPMYAAGLLLTGALVADAPSPARGLAWLALAAVLAAKVRVEERSLRSSFAGYDDYARRTKRVVPGVW